MATPTQPTEPNDLLAQAVYLRRLATALVGDHHLAEDLAQQSIVVALEKGTGGSTEFLLRLRGVLRHLVWRHRRAASRRSARERRAIRPVEPGPIDRVVQAEVLATLMEAVKQLPPALRDAVLRHYFDGSSESEIAKADGLSVAAVDSRLRRARVELRIALRRRMGDEDWLSGLLGVALPRVRAEGPGASLWSGRVVELVGRVVLGAGLVGVAAWILGLVVGGTSSGQPEGLTTTASTAGPISERGGISSPSASDVGLAPGAQRLALDAGSIFVRVVSEDDRPIEGAVVRAFTAARTDASSWGVFGYGFDLSTCPSAGAEGPTGADGRVGLSRANLPDGVTLVVEAEHFLLQRRSDLEAPPPGQDWYWDDVALQPGRSVRVLVTDPEGEAISGAEVSVNARYPMEEGICSTILQRTGPDGWASFLAAPLCLDWSVARAVGFQTGSISLGREADGVDPAIFQLVLERGGRISGKVLDADGRPVVGAPIYSNSYGPGSTSMSGDNAGPGGMNELCLRDYSDEDGRFQATGLLAYPSTTCWIGTKVGSLWVETHPVFLGEEITLTLPRGVELRGRFLGQDGLPASSAKIAVTPWDEDHWPPLFVGEANGEGAFSCTLPAGNYALFAWHPAGWWIQDEPIALAGGRDRGELRLQEGGRLLVKAQEDARSSPVPNAWIHLGLSGWREPKSGDLPGEVTRHYTLRHLLGDALEGPADSRGESRYSGLPPGTWNARGYAAGFLRGVGGVEVLAGGESEVTLSLARSATSSILVEVRDEFGAPVAGAEVIAQLVEAESTGESGIHQTSTSSVGTTSLQRLVPGTWKIFAEHRGRRSEELLLSLGEDPVETVLQLPPAAALEVRVSGPNGPQANGLVQIGDRRASGAFGTQMLLVRASATTDQDGLATFTDLAVGPQTLRCALPQGFATLVDLDLDSGPNFLDVDLAGVSLSGRILGAPEEGALVQVMRFQHPDRKESVLRILRRLIVEFESLDPTSSGFAGMDSSGTRTDPSGRFRMDYLAPGSYVLYAAAEGCTLAGPHFFEVGTEDVGGVELEIRRAGEVRVELVGLREALRLGEFRRIQVRAAGPGGEERFTNSFDGSAGSRQLRGMVPGLWTLELQGMKTLRGEWTVLEESATLVEPGRAAEVTFVVPRTF